MVDNLRNPKKIPDPENEDQMIDNPDYDPDFNEDGTPIDKNKEPKKEDDDKDPLKPLKEKLYKAFKERDEARKETERLKKEKRDAELERLKAEGKEKEHYEGRISDLQSENASLKQQVIELTRDNTVQQALTGYNFRNDRAAKTAARDIVAELVQDDNGVWVHRSGKSIPDFIKSFAEDEDNAFLFKPKENKGSGNPPREPNKPNSGKKSILEMSQKEVMELAAKGKL